MTRRGPSGIELMLIAEVEKHGLTVTATQLERWRQQLWLPRTKEWIDPDTSALRHEILKRALELALLSQSGRSLRWIGWTFWAITDTSDTAKRLREAVIKALKRPFERAGVDFDQVPAGDSEEAFQAREKIAAGMMRNRRSPRRDFDGILRAHAATSDIELPPPRSVPNIFHKSFLEPGARMMVGGVGDVGFEGLMEAWSNASPDSEETIEHIRAAHLAAQLAGDDDPMTQNPMADGLPGLIRTVEATDDRLLCAAVRACTKGSGTLAKLIERALYEPEIIPRLMADVMWDQWVRVGGLAPLGVAGEAAIAINTVQYLVIPNWAEDLASYQALMESLLVGPLPQHQV